MRGADRPIGRLRKPSLPSARRAPSQVRPLPAEEEPADLVAVEEYTHSPARGIVLGLAPALLIWAGLVTLFARLMR